MIELKVWTDVPEGRTVSFVVEDEHGTLVGQGQVLLRKDGWGNATFTMPNVSNLPVGTYTMKLGGIQTVDLEIKENIA